ncbi:SCO family protein [Cupriavidus plantarum]|uniref:SCO family protein n=1 Tax=Cupriavidus plantarum TaxID=942865 RepID=UPI000E2612A6|nr:SCO family protein [Cupriavidus plantarum]REF01989.1 protein SCO1/2 [Cupriavidus plantarum]RLK45164.1 protein SCO1/2 [Cupriavidus plantarum]
MRAGARSRWPGVVLWLALAASALGIHGLTDGWRAWTLDQRREHRIAAGTLRLPALMVRDQAGRGVRWFGGDAGRAGGDALAGPDAVYLVDFIYTRCMTVCRALGAAFTQLQARIEADGLSGRIGLRSLSFDPRDEIADLAGYAGEHRARLPDWAVAAAVDPAAMHALLRDADVIAIPDGFGGFAHNGGLHVVDARGHVLGAFPLDRYEDAYALARATIAGAPGWAP